MQGQSVQRMLPHELMIKLKESVLRFCDCTNIWVIVEGADNRLHCYRTADEGHSRHAIFRDFTQPKSVSTGLLVIEEQATEHYFSRLCRIFIVKSD